MEHDGSYAKRDDKGKRATGHPLENVAMTPVGFQVLIASGFLLFLLAKREGFRKTAGLPGNESAA